MYTCSLPRTFWVVSSYTIPHRSNIYIVSHRHFVTFGINIYGCNLVEQLGEIFLSSVVEANISMSRTVFIRVELVGIK